MILKQFTNYSRKNSKKNNTTTLKIDLPNGEIDVYELPYMNTSNINKVFDVVKNANGIRYFYKGVI